VPPEEIAARTEERCAIHAQRTAVAHCRACDRALCIACAIPVRNDVYGSECISIVLGNDVPGAAEHPARPRPSGAVIAATVAFAVAALGTALPWTRFQEGSGPFGAWGLSPRWSMLAVAGSVVGVIASTLAWRGGDGSLLSVLRIAAVLVVAGSALAILRPPAFAPPWIGPWVTLAGGVAAASVTLAAVRTTPRERRHVPA
jgi:hypothetical protein